MSHGPATRQIRFLARSHTKRKVQSAKAPPQNLRNEEEIKVGKAFERLSTNKPTDTVN